MASATASTSDKTDKRIMPGTPVAVTIPHGDVSLFYKGQVFTSGQVGSSDGIYNSTYQGGTWKGGLDAPPICPTAHADPSAVAAISWSKAEQRIYFIGEDDILQEYCFSGDHWTPGGLQKNMKLRAIPSSSLAAVHWYDGERGSCIRIFYQAYEEGSGSRLQSPIKEVRWTNSKHWHMGPTLVYALPGCGLAAVTYRLNDQQQIHLFYQSLELTLSELYYYEVRDHWLPGEKNMGIAGDSTPITAVGWVDGADEELQVYWRNKADDAEIVGAAKSSKQSGIPKWMPIDPVVGGLSFNDHFAVAHWQRANQTFTRLYYTSNSTSLLELCNDDGAGWVPGAKFGGSH